MRWISKELDQYLQAKEYVDTALLPLLPISFGPEMRQSGIVHEYISFVSLELEKQFKGRVLLIPPFHYLQADSGKSKTLKLLRKELEEQGIKHVYYLTADSVWKGVEETLDGELIWIPAFSLNGMEALQIKGVIGEQVRQISELFSMKWKNSN
ncbi:YpiF family protein [Bacillus massiliglaciei]|uniref:YpiF family protein n=1 Tax=Bacillus massiliglaciei TaxID=1816693 RepID=UPI000DA63308|nr:YpiF family protein [Bacillus massiliglaciei]